MPFRGSSAIRRFTGLGSRRRCPARAILLGSFAVRSLDPSLPLTRFAPRAIVVFALLVVLVSLSGQARAQRKTLSGTWSATSMVERYNVGEWGSKCGPRPGGQGAPGGSVTISQVGNELDIRGAGRSYSTTNCWEQAPGLQRVSHSASARGWSNRCTTAAGDPRRATVITTISATDDAIHFDETGSYQFVLEGQNCTASVRRTRSFRLVQRQGEAPVAASAPPAATPAPTPTASSPPPKPTKDPQDDLKSCTDPGEPARLEVRPARKLIRAGESFSFRARIVDDQGCPLSVAPTWRVVQGEAKVSVTTAGKVTVEEGSPEGTADIQVSVGDKSVRVSVEVASRERYESLLEARGLNELGETDEAAIAVIATGSLGSGAAVAEDTAKKRKTIFAVVVGGAAFVVALVGFILLRKGARARKKDEDEDEDVVAPQRMQVPERAHGFAPGVADASRPRQRHEVYEVERGAETPSQPRMLCPVCKEEFVTGSLFCPNDGTRLVKASAASGAMRAPAGGICPTCARGFPPDIKYCPEHREPLVPAPIFNATTAKRPLVEAKRGKICPTCGMRYEGEAVFCGKDGTALVLVN